MFDVICNGTSKGIYLQRNTQQQIAALLNIAHRYIQNVQSFYTFVKRYVQAKRVLPRETAVLSLMLRLFRNSTHRPVLRELVRPALLSPRLRNARSANESSVHSCQ